MEPGLQGLDPRDDHRSRARGPPSPAPGGADTLQTFFAERANASRNLKPPGGEKTLPGGSAEVPILLIEFLRR